MSKIETGGPAFPVDNVIARDDIGHLVGTEISSGGMTLRDYFAAKAIGYTIDHWLSYSKSAEDAYKIADAMIEARK